MTNERYRFFLLIAIIVCLVAACSYCNQRLGLADDNVAEELVEEIIKAKTALDIDLTPSTPER